MSVVFQKEKTCLTSKILSWPLLLLQLAQLPLPNHANQTKSGFVRKMAMKLSALASGGFDSSGQFNLGYCEWPSLKRFDSSQSRRQMPLPISSCRGWHAARK
jgi:hypothetical protein